MPLSTWRPTPGTKTGRVWEIADDLAFRLGRLPKVSEVVKAYAAEDGHPGTGQVQYYAWRNAQGHGPPEASSAIAHAAPKDPLGPGWLAVMPDGRLTLPTEVRQAMRLDAPGHVQVEVVDGELRLRSVPVVTERLQAMFRAFDKGEGSIVDELIADRRAEAARE